MATFTDVRGSEITALQGPEVTAAMGIESRLSRVVFGDGYEQVAPDGLNSDSVTWSLEFGALDENASMVLFKEAVAAQATAVTYTVPSDSQRVYRVQAGTVKRQALSRFAWEVSFDLREVHGHTPDTTQTLTEALGL